ncbi:MAG: carboxypeptidase-like regulatory domain-containing protein [Planctomycetaceae bacterium]|jgi:hypothetical protein|nr:carboxypeptidase-like regulatory domain-containing protein [Planctomycetaceae bacterium]
MKHLFIITVSLLCICICVSGCGNVPIGGRVTFSDNGEPLPTGTVCFVNGNQQGNGKIDASGYYKLDFGNKRGIPKGEYKIYIEAFREEPETTGEKTVNPATGKEEAEMFIKRTSLIDAKYENIETSGLSMTVDGKTKTLDIKVDRP